MEKQKSNLRIITSLPKQTNSRHPNAKPESRYHRVVAVAVAVGAVLGIGGYMYDGATTPLKLINNERQVKALARYKGYDISFEENSHQGVSANAAATVFTVLEKGCVIPDVEADTVTQVVDHRLYNHGFGASSHNITGLSTDWQIEPFSPLASAISKTAYDEYSQDNFNIPFPGDAPICSQTSAAFKEFVAANPQHPEAWGSLYTIESNAHVPLMNPTVEQPLTNGEIVMNSIGN